MVTRAGLRFQLSRTAGLIRTIFSNRMASIGLLLLLLFAFFAIASPLLSPYTPYDVVSGRLAQPEWVMNFPDGYYLSKNIVVASDPTFGSPAAMSEWKIGSSNGNFTRLRVSYSPTQTAPSDSGGSVLITNTGDQPVAVDFSKTFAFPYNGPPRRFVANFAIKPVTADSANPVGIDVYITRGSDGQKFHLWYLDSNANDTVGGAWLASSGSQALDSGQNIVGTSVGTKSSGFDAAQVVFSSVANYTYGIRLSISPHQAVYLDSLQLKLYGTAWGLFGTDITGADVWTQLVYGSRISLTVGLSAAGIGIGLGLLVGLLAGFLGRVIDEALMRFTDMMLVIPGLPLLIVLVAVLGQHIINVVIIIGFFGWMGFARIVRAQVLSLRERPFIEAAKASGSGPGRIITRHIFPNIVSLTYVNLALSVPGAILTESALAFLGLSDPAVVSWGNMFSSIQQSGGLRLNPPPWWWILPPGFSIALVSLSFVLIGYALDEIFNPKLRRRR